MIANVLQKNILGNAVSDVKTVAEHLRSLINAETLRMIVIKVKRVLGEDFSSLVYLLENNRSLLRSDSTLTLGKRKQSIIERM